MQQQQEQQRQQQRELLGGYAPLVIAAVLALLVVLAVPSVAPEHVISVPADGATTTTVPLPTTPTTAAP